MKAQEICDKLNLNLDDILNIYPYGSQVYGNAKENSDHDYIIVYKRSLLPSGAFKDNAISSQDRNIQGICYSRGGFIDAINNYQMSALECIFLPEDMIVKNTFKFKMNKYVEKEFISKVISLASASWHNAQLSFKDDNFEYVKKNIYHAIRIIDFAIQIKNEGKIVDYTSTNSIKKLIYSTPFDCDSGKEFLNDWNNRFIEKSKELK